ncbi:DUF4190 domain-containing protein, partial [Streptomyces chilikensis]|uniref:DUF4190 domain-containing protein n=1 Tax=Streptomyces chilikensis TaxID=1194079 RepID=UPI00140CB6E5
AEGRDPWAPPEPGSAPQAPAAPAAAPYAAPPAGGFGPPVPPGAQGAGPYPYGPPPGPYGAPAHQPSYNGLAITALVLGIVCCVPLLGVVFGVIALVQIRRTGQRGKGMAIAGVVLSALTSLLLVVSLLTGAWDDFGKEFGEGFKEGARGANVTAGLEPGECFDEPGTPDGASDLESYEVLDIEEVSCDGPHDGEAYARFDLPEGSYPGEDEVIGLADERCSAEVASYSIDAWKVSRHAYYTYFYPMEENWTLLDDRAVVCVFASLTEPDPLTVPLRQDKDALGTEQLAYLEPAAKVNTALARVPFDMVEDDLEGHQEWADQVAEELTGFSGAVRAHDWEPDAAPLAEKLADEVDAARGEWEKLAAADDADDFYLLWGEAELALTDGTDSAVALRGLLDLATERPAADDEEYVAGVGAL